MPDTTTGTTDTAADTTTGADGAGIARLGVVVLDCPDPDVLAAFYTKLFGWDVADADPEWVTIGNGVPGAVQVAFQRVEGYVEPAWPTQEPPQQFHLDLEVPDLDRAERAAVAIGARVAETQPAPSSFRVLLDPAGHPFCLCRSSAE